MRTAALVLFCMLGTLSYGQKTFPALLAKMNGQLQAMRITKMRADVTVWGDICETQMTLTFFNPHNRQLSGTLFFPVPVGATVSGYGLDIKGTMMEGVVVDKDRARIIYEKVVRRRVDPGLVEWTKGNVFRTRVFPLPARGSRTISISYLSEIEKGKYRLPFVGKDRIPEFELHLTLLEKPVSRGEITVGGKPLEFRDAELGVTAKIKAKDLLPDKELVIDLKRKSGRQLLVETAPDGNCYFVAVDYPKHPKHPKPTRPPEKIMIFWDASGSRSSSDALRQIQFVKEFFKQIQLQKDSRQTIDVELIVFRHTAEKARQFKVVKSNATELLAALHQIRYDGGTQLGSVSPALAGSDIDLCLVFTDGFSNFGYSTSNRFAVPVHTISSAMAVDSYALRRMSSKSNGQFINLVSLSPKRAVARLLQPRFEYLPDKSTVKHVETYPRIAVAAGQRMIVAGRLDAAEASVPLCYGGNGRLQDKRTVRVSKTSAIKCDLLWRYWAQLKLRDLLIDQERNKEEIKHLGVAHNLVTPYTSFLVLESLSQYLEFNVTPPRSAPELRRKFQEEMARRGRQREETRRKNLDGLAAKWKEMSAWHETHRDGKEYFRKAGVQLEEAKDLVAKRELPSATNGFIAAHEVLQSCSHKNSKLAEQVSKNYRNCLTDAADRLLTWAAMGGSRERSLNYYLRAKYLLDKASLSDTARQKQNRAKIRQIAQGIEICKSQYRSRLDRWMLDAQTLAGRGRKKEAIEMLERILVVDPTQRAAKALLQKHCPEASARRELYLGLLQGKQWAPIRKSNLFRVDTTVMSTIKLNPIDMLLIEPELSEDIEMESRTYACRRAGGSYGGRAGVDTRDEESVPPDNPSSPNARITMKKWDPQMAYLKAIKAAESALQFEVYMDQKRSYGTSPGFYLDCAYYFAEVKQPKLAAQILSNVAELQLDNTAHLRTLGHRLAQIEQLDYSRLAFKEVLRLRPEEPQSFRDLALVLTRMGRHKEAIDILVQLVSRRWDRFADIELIALVELNEIYARCPKGTPFPLGDQFRTSIPTDLRVVMTWDTDATDMDLYVVEPTGEEVFFGHNRGKNGSRMSKDFTDGYGPEEYLCPTTMVGEYKIRAKYFGSRSRELIGPVTLQVELFTNYGRPTQKRQAITIRLDEAKERINIGKIKF